MKIEPQCLTHMLCHWK